MESHDYLFFNYSYSHFVWQGMQHKLGIAIPTTSWDAFITWVGGTWRKNIQGMLSLEFVWVSLFIAFGRKGIHGHFKMKLS